MIDRQVDLSQTAFATPASAGAEYTITIARPQLATGRNNSVDPVTEQVRPVLRAGKATILQSAALVFTGVLLKKVQLVDYRDSYGSPTVTPLFASGASDTTTKTVFDGSMPLLGWGTYIVDILTNIVLGANEQIVLTLEADAVSRVGNFDVIYDFGRNDGDLRLKS